MLHLDWTWIIFGLPAFILAGSVHEYMHAWTARRLGDYTATMMGRLTLNPIKHIDPIGLILMVLVHFGWMVPVPVDEYNFRRPVRDMALVAVVGPLSNLAMAVLSAGILRILYAFPPTGGDMAYKTFMAIGSGVVPHSFWYGAWSIAMMLCLIFLQVNVILFLFNLLPIPPLDGYRIVRLFIPVDWRYYWEQLEKYSFILLALILLPISPFSTLLLKLLTDGVGATTAFLLHMVGLY